MLVVLAHAGFAFPGGLGVTVFFVISGFVITRLLVRELARTGAFSASKFAARRALKILPPLVAIVLVPTVLLSQTVSINLLAVTSQLGFFFNWYTMQTGNTGVLPGSGVVWSLSIEEQFYLAIALIWMPISRSQHPKRWLLVVLSGLWVSSTMGRTAISLVSGGSRDLSGNLTRIYFGTDTRMSTIAAGGLLALLLDGSPRQGLLGRLSRGLGSRWTLPLALVLLGISLSVRNDFFRDSARYTLQEIATVLLICGALTRGAWPGFVTRLANLRLVQMIGLASYSIYLAHLIVIILIERFVSGGALVLPVARVVIGVAAGLACHLAFDRPLEQLRSRLRTAPASG